MPAVVGSMFSDPKRETALPRRTLLATEFNREAVRRAESRVTQCTARFLDKLGYYAEIGRPVDLTHGLMCLMCDGVMSFAYQKPYGALDAEDFNSDILMPVHEFHGVLQYPTYFPRLFNAIFKVTDLLPTWMLHRGLAVEKKYLKVSLAPYRKMARIMITMCVTIPSGTTRSLRHPCIMAIST